MKVSRREQTVEWVHPEDSSFVITLRRVTRRESLEYQAEVAKAVRAVVVTNPDGSAYVNKDGSVLTQTVHDFTPEMSMNALRRVVTGWRGLTDEDSNEIPFNDANLPLLLELQSEGKPLGETIVLAAVNEKTFDPDPKANG